MKQSDIQILKKIIDEIEAMERLIGDMDIDEFLSSEVTERASAMTAINIGELAKRLSADFYAEYPNTELRYAARTRDVYAHGYFTLSFDAVFKTAKQDYPMLKESITSILDE